MPSSTEPINKDIHMTKTFMDFNVYIGFESMPVTKHWPSMVNGIVFWSKAAVRGVGDGNWQSIVVACNSGHIRITYKQLFMFMPSHKGYEHEPHKWIMRPRA